MGASGWEYFVPYQLDIAAALNALRYQAFEKGDYHKIGTKQQIIAEVRERLAHLEDEAPTPEFQEVIGSSLQAYLHELEALPEPPQTIDERITEMFTINGQDGAGSILDIDRISDKPDFGTVVPLSESELIDMFGTSQPGHAAIIEHRDELMQLRERWVGSYLIVYKDGQPDEIYFCGFSGD
jgi:hypothetical protein